MKFFAVVSRETGKRLGSNLYPDLNLAQDEIDRACHILGNDQPRIAFKAAEVHEEPSTWLLTDAPKELDGFGTRHVVFNRDAEGYPQRVVDVQNRHLDWQKRRYQTAQYAVWDY